jgi:hypothetical protein
LKVWVTGITPIGLDLLSSFSPTNLTFQESMAHAVGLRDEDITNMLAVVDGFMPFADDAEKARFRDAIKLHFNNIKYGNGSDLYHTRMVNDVMQYVLIHNSQRAPWLASIKLLPKNHLQRYSPS